MKTYKTLICQKDEECPHIFYLILNRPDKGNAISIGPGEMTDELQDALKVAEQDDEVKVIVIKANGKHFCAGFDLSMVYRVYGGGPDVKPFQGKRLQVDEDHVVGIRRALFYCKKILVTQIHGWCIEAGIVPGGGQRHRRGGKRRTVRPQGTKAGLRRSGFHAC